MTKTMVVLVTAALVGMGAVAESGTAEARGRHVAGNRLFVVASGYGYGPGYYSSAIGFGAYVPPSYYQYYYGLYPAYYGCQYRRAGSPACVY